MNVDVRQEPDQGPYAYDYEEHGRRWPFVLLAVALAFLLAAGSSVLWLQHQVNPPGPLGPSVHVTVAKGMSTVEIGQLLAKQGVIANATVFKYYVKLTGSGTIEAGDYTLNKRSNMGQVMKVLEAGAAKAADDKITVPEGLTLQGIADIVGQLPNRSADKFVAAAKSGAVHSQYQPAGSTNLDGFILPETYFVAKTDDETAILKKMVDSFDQLASQLDLTGAAARLHVTPYQAIIVASIVEREALIDADRGKVARVIYNRLDAKMQLQMDSTVLYAIGQPGKSNVTEADRKVNSPYNTFIAPGLPPGPISQPGRASLEGALAPPAGDWLYFVTTDTSGASSFTSSYNQFLKDVATCQSKGLC
ncbi:MAG TPA: endolytic transglycosylase MltG [Acidimicrobiales bacterium]|nr:endolytic transglycosylase MltG [Acidimicrobiales bacterium]